MDKLTKLDYNGKREMKLLRPFTQLNEQTLRSWIIVFTCSFLIMRLLIPFTPWPLGYFLFAFILLIGGLLPFVIAIENNLSLHFRIWGPIIIALLIIYSFYLVPLTKGVIPETRISGAEVELKSFFYEAQKPDFLMPFTTRRFKKNIDEPTWPLNTEYPQEVAQSILPNLLIVEHNRYGNTHRPTGISELHWILPDERRAMSVDQVEWIIAIESDWIYLEDNKMQNICNVVLFSVADPNQITIRRFEGMVIHGKGGGMRPVRRIGGKTKWVRDGVTYDYGSSPFPLIRDIFDWIPVDWLKYTSPFDKDGFWTPEKRVMQHLLKKTDEGK